MAGRGSALPAEFEFDEGRHDDCYGAASWSSGIDALPQRAQHDLALTEIGDGASDFGNGTAKPINGRHDDRVPSSRVVEQSQRVQGALFWLTRRACR